ncbi:MAG: glycoside hydrolase family 25 protein [Actinomycetota bacterium]|nr:glycoside hydrolase family 25 protein [Actinomycetota bacterium]
MTGSVSAMASINGPDVSSYQHPSGYSINWGSAHASGSATFGFVKATEGSGYTNPYFASDFAAMAATGMIRGAYHFASPSISAVTQAQYFVRVSGTLHQRGDLPPVLDLESTGGLSPTALIAWTQSYLQTVKALTGRTPIIYASPYFWQTAMANSQAFTGYPLWIASYGSAPQIPGGWSSYTFWQYTASASLSGIRGAVDMSVFNGSLASLQALSNGPATAAAPPFGHVDGVAWNGSALVAAGWAIDPGTANPISVSVSVDGATLQTGTASTARADIARAYPAYGANHGYAVAVPAAPGNHSVCVTALGLLARSLGCLTVVVPPSKPFGHVDVAAWNGSALVAAGWAIDPDTANPSSVSVSVDGATPQTTTASTARADIARAYPAYGANHGYAVAVPASPGNHSICVTALNTGAGTADTSLGCRTVAVPFSAPFGHFDVAAWNGSALFAAGWAIDPDTADPINVSVSVDGATPWTGMASTARADIARAYPAYGANHSYAVTAAAPPGPHSVCVTALNTGAGTADVPLGCRTVVVPPSKPIGHLDLAAWNGSALVAAGWAIDPDTANPSSVSVSVDGATPQTIAAGAARADIARAYPAYGANHGYAVTASAAPGPHSVCVTALNTGAGTADTPLGCRTVVVPPSKPFGHLDAVAWNGSALVAAGWAIDPDTANPSSVSVSVDRAAPQTGTASTARADVARAYPAYGANHGYAVTAPAARGRHSVCVTALNTGAGTADTPLGCRIVSVP